MRVLNFCTKYKYALTIIVFLLYLFFSDNNILVNRELKKEINKLENKLEHCKSTVYEIKGQSNRSSVTTKEEEEEYFRKRHHLKKENEDIFRIVYDRNEE